MQRNSEDCVAVFPLWRNPVLESEMTGGGSTRAFPTKHELFLPKVHVHFHTGNTHWNFQDLVYFCLPILCSTHLINNVSM